MRAEVGLVEVGRAARAKPLADLERESELGWLAEARQHRR